MLAISTAWNSKHSTDPKQMLTQIKEIGFDAIELGYNFTPDRLEELLPFISEIDLKVVSVHNFCPMTTETGLNRFAADAYRLSSLDEAERRKAIDYTKGSIDTARRVGSEVVVIHAGAVEIDQDYIKAPLRLYSEGKFNSQEFRRAKESLLSTRNAQKKPYLESVVRSLEEVVAYAYSSAVKIGLETRYYLNEIPNLEEAEYLLNRFHNKGLFYWHDSGHAEVGERLGVVPHEDYFKKFGHLMLGIHLHDLKGIDDHYAPFTGDFDFSRVIPYLGEDLIKVIEAHPPATPEQLKEAIKRL